MVIKTLVFMSPLLLLGGCVDDIAGGPPWVIAVTGSELRDVVDNEVLSCDDEDGECVNTAVGWEAGAVVEFGVEATVPAGHFTDCVKTRDSTALDPSLPEFKTYCPGVGLVLVEEGATRVELVEHEDF